LSKDTSTQTREFHENDEDQNYDKYSINLTTATTNINAYSPAFRIFRWTVQFISTMKISESCSSHADVWFDYVISSDFKLWR